MPLSTINSNSFSSTANTNIDNGALFIDAVNGRVGAGTTAPLSQLHAKGAGSGTFAPYNDPLVVEGSDYTYLHLKSSNSQAGVIYNRGGSTGWFHGLDNSGNLKTVYMSAINGTALGNAKDGTAAMLIDSSNRVTKPSQPFFYAERSGSAQTGYNAASQADAVVIYNNVITNTGSHYNGSTGKFTAPVDGIYAFFAGAYSSTMNFNQMWLVLNGARANGTDWNYGSGSVNFQVGHWIIKLSANDTIGFHPYNGSVTSGSIDVNGSHVYFRGALLG